MFSSQVVLDNLKNVFTDQNHDVLRQQASVFYWNYYKRIDTKCPDHFTIKPNKHLLEITYAFNDHDALFTFEIDKTDDDALSILAYRTNKNGNQTDKFNQLADGVIKISRDKNLSKTLVEAITKQWILQEMHMMLANQSETESECYQPFLMLPLTEICDTIYEFAAKKKQIEKVEVEMQAPVKYESLKPIIAKANQNDHALVKLYNDISRWDVKCLPSSLYARTKDKIHSRLAIDGVNDPHKDDKIQLLALLTVFKYSRQFLSEDIDQQEQVLAMIQDKIKPLELQIKLWLNLHDLMKYVKNEGFFVQRKIPSHFNQSLQAVLESHSSEFFNCLSYICPHQTDNLKKFVLDNVDFVSPKNNAKNTI